MFTLFEESAEFREINQQMKGILSELTARLALTPSPSQFSKDHSFFDSKQARKQFFFVRDGFARFEVQRKVLLMFEPGDLFGWRTIVADETTVIADSSMSVDVYDTTAFSKALKGDTVAEALWHSYLDTEYNLHVVLLSSILEEIAEEGQERLSFEPGELIIQEGDTADKVFLMLKGQAEVTVGDIKVGEVISGEIFGAMAATTNTRRSASVIAKTRCSVSAVPKENFLVLVKTHPRTVQKLIEDMARIIVSQNEKIVSMTQ